MTDEVMREVWKIKDAICKENGGNVRVLADRLRKRDRPKDQKIVDLPYRGMARTGST